MRWGRDGGNGEKGGGQGQQQRCAGTTLASVFSLPIDSRHRAVHWPIARLRHSPVRCSLPVMVGRSGLGSARRFPARQGRAAVVH